ncbi:MAG: addiction module protein, partial [Nostoc sp. DedQUE04]|uniref:addiction module protein n=1 Tax=Nostoc sp. DedQUE04 TaxID=3075390 RepID=UPI002AD5243D
RRNKAVLSFFHAIKYESYRHWEETVEKLRLELSQLSIEERAELAYFLIHSLDKEVDKDIDLAWDIQLTQRLEDISSGIVSGEQSDKVFTELRDKYS